MTLFLEKYNKVVMRLASNLNKLPAIENSNIMTICHTVVRAARIGYSRHVIQNAIIEIKQILFSHNIYHFTKNS